MSVTHVRFKKKNGTFKELVINFPISYWKEISLDVSDLLRADRNGTSHTTVYNFRSKFINKTGGNQQKYQHITTLSGNMTWVPHLSNHFRDAIQTKFQVLNKHIFIAWYEAGEIKKHQRHEWCPLFLSKRDSEIYYIHVIQSAGRYCVLCRLEVPHPTPSCRSLNEISHCLLCSSEGSRTER